MIVSNTTPISNFLHLGQMEILKKIFKELHIPGAVHREIEAFFSGDRLWINSNSTLFASKYRVYAL